MGDILRHGKLNFEGMSDPIMLYRLCIFSKLVAYSLYATSLLKIHKKFHKIFNICPRTKKKGVLEYSEEHTFCKLSYINIR